MISIWVVTDHPKDFPDYYVARRFKGDKPTGEVMTDRSLEELRRILKAFGLFCIPRDATDDPVIVETWV